MTILFIPTGNIQTASARFRAYWIAECMEDARVIPIDEVTQGDIDASDVVIWGKRIAPFDQHPGQRIYWDICDPVHWFNDQELTRDFADHCEAVVTSNPGLTDDFNDWYKSNKAITIVDRLKLEHFSERRIHAPSDPVRLIWFGNSINRWALLSVMADLLRLKYCGVKVTLTICDDKPEDTWQAEFPIEHVRWSLDTENKIISSHDIAILPDMPGRNGRVKSENKRITAWANGLPVFDGKVPFYWLVQLCQRPKLRQSEAIETYTFLERNYQVRGSARDWKDLLR